MSKNILIAYFTRSANTQRIAEIIQKKTNGRIFEIKPEVPYPEPYQEVVDQAKKEINAGYLPALESYGENAADCDMIFIGTPNWWSTMAPPVASFLDKTDLAGKKVIPFCTHGGGGAGHIIKDIKKACPEAQVLKELTVYGDGGSASEGDISAWLKELDII